MSKTKSSVPQNKVSFKNVLEVLRGNYCRSISKPGYGSKLSTIAVRALHLDWPDRPGFPVHVIAPWLLTLADRPECLQISQCFD